MKIKKMTVTPKLASRWLQKNGHNRPLRLTYAQRLAQSITAGQWRLNGETIKFNCDGTLVDGQHRLKAVEISGTPIESYVVEGVELDAFDTIDQGTRRKLSDVFARHGEKHYTSLSTAVRYVECLDRYYSGETPTLDWKSGLRPDQAIVCLDRHPRVRDSVQSVMDFAVRDVMSIGIASALHYFCACKSRAAADEFWAAVGSGENLTKGMGAYALRKLLINGKGSDKQPSRLAIIVMAAKAWNAYRAKKNCLKLFCSEGEQPPTLK